MELNGLRDGCYGCCNDQHHLLCIAPWKWAFGSTGPQHSYIWNNKQKERSSICTRTVCVYMCVCYPVECSVRVCMYVSSISRTRGFDYAPRAVFKMPADITMWSPSLMLCKLYFAEELCCHVFLFFRGFSMFTVGVFFFFCQSLNRGSWRRGCGVTHRKDSFPGGSQPINVPKFNIFAYIYNNVTSF